MLTLTSICFTIGIVLFFKFLNMPHKPPLLGVYQQKNKWYCLKFILMFTVLSLNQLYRYLKRRLAIEFGHSDDGTIHIHKEDAVLEKIQHLGDHPFAVDAVYFNGVAESGAALVCSVARRTKGACDAFLLLKVDGEELLLSPKLPDSCLQQKEIEQDQYMVEGITLKNVVPMRSWTIEYSGKMRPRNNVDKTVQVELSLNWSTPYQPFNYNRIAPCSLAKDLAREPWSSGFFKLLNDHREEHYEQMGDIEGTAIIEGKKYNLNMRCLRDHSFGKHRDWRNIHRYVYHFIYLKNGDCIAVGSASLPLTMSHLTVGYMCRKSDHSVYPVTWSNFKLYQHGEKQVLPKDYGFAFKAGGKDYVVQVLVKDEESYYIGKNREAKMYDRWCKFEVNGAEGWGCSEWHYNNVQNARQEIVS